MHTLLLIDANSLIHRSFHAIPPLTSKNGKPIQAIYGLTNIFLKLWREEKPTYAVALFDRPEPTFRKERYAAYKAQRPKAPDALVSQIIEAHNFFHALGVRFFEAPGFEADDLIATFTDRFRNSSEIQKIIILTGDLDTLQLVEGDRIVVRTFKKGISDTVLYNEQAVMDRYGLPPLKLIHYKALVGDPSDNIKGVSGIGPKTATRLVVRYGSVSEILREYINEPTLKDKFEGKEEDLQQALELVTLRKDVPVDIGPIHEFSAPNIGESIKQYCEAQGFQSIVKRLNAM